MFDISGSGFYKLFLRLVQSMESVMITSSRGGEPAETSLLPGTARLPGFLSSCEGAEGTTSRGCWEVGVHWDRVRMLCSSAYPGCDKPETAAQQAASHSTSPGGPAALSTCQLQVGRDSGLILLAPVHMTILHPPVRTGPPSLLGLGASPTP